MFVYHTSLTGQQTYFGDTYGGGAGADTPQDLTEMPLADTKIEAVV